jgi:hypothetical protein
VPTTGAEIVLKEPRNGFIDQLPSVLDGGDERGVIAGDVEVDVEVRRFLELVEELPVLRDGEWLDVEVDVRPFAALPPLHRAEEVRAVNLVPCKHGQSASNRLAATCRPFDHRRLLGSPTLLQQLEHDR